MAFFLVGIVALLLQKVSGKLMLSFVRASLLRATQHISPPGWSRLLDLPFVLA